MTLFLLFPKLIGIESSPCLDKAIAESLCLRLCQYWNIVLCLQWHVLSLNITNDLLVFRRQISHDRAWLSRNVYI